MNSIMKKIVFVVAFVLVTLVLPTLLMLFFVDVNSRFSTYFVVYGLILFSIFGYIVASVRSMEKKLEDALEDIKMQNAAIAYKISNDVPEDKTVTTNFETAVVQNDNLNIPLNPSDPIGTPVVKTIKKVSDDGFDDFK